MSKYTQGQLIALKSDRSITGAIIGIIEGYPETRYQVFTAAGIQTYYESQIVSQDSQDEIENVNAERFHAGLTASLIRNPTISSLYSLNTAQIDFIPHQFRPVLKFIRSDRPRLLIADSVGVGKTIEAGLILRELQARSNLDSVLIICPRPLITEEKWETEMKRFGEEFTSIKSGDLFRHCIHELDMDGEWPEKYKRTIIPYSLFDENNVFGTDKRPGLLRVDPPKFDLVIVDEAHHIRNTATYAYRAVSRFCDAAEAVVMLTATPVQLQDDDLFVLLNLLRPDMIIDRNTFHDMAEPNGYINAAATLVRGYKEGWQQAAYDQLCLATETEWGKKVFRGNPAVRDIFTILKKEDISIEERVQLISDIENMHTFSNLISRTRRRDIGEFTIRKPYTVAVDFTPEQRDLHDRVLSVIHDILSKVHCTDNTKFMMTTIRRQTASCIFGLVPTLKSILYRHLGEIMDGEKTIYYKDVVGIQYKRSGVTIGYLQFETSSGTMNHDKSNYFSENTFTFESDKDEIMEEVYEYIIGIFDELKSASTEITVNTSDGIRTEKLNALLEFYYRELVKNNPEYHNMQKMLKEDVSDLEKEVTDALMQYNEVRAEAKLLNENILKNQEQLDKLQGEIIRLKTYGKASSVSEKIKLKEAESEKLELLLVELKKEKNEIDERLEQKKEDHSKKYQLLKEKQSELRKTQ